MAVMKAQKRKFWINNQSAIKPSQTFDTLRGIAYGGGQYVAITNTSKVVTSNDGATWEPITTPSGNWMSICYGNGRFVVVGLNSTNRAMTSTDGINWTASAAVGTAWQSVCFGNGTFVAVTDTGTGSRAMTSTDGTTWTLRTTAADNLWKSVTYGAGLFVAVATSGTGNRVMTSPTGTTWTIRTSAADSSWVDVCWNGTTFVAVHSGGGTSGVMSSTNGTTWTIRTTPSGNWTKVAYGNGVFFAVANGGTAGQRAMYSANGTTGWTLKATVEDNAWSGICYGDKFVAVSSSGLSRCMTITGSPDNWVARDIGSVPVPQTKWNSVIHAVDNFDSIGRYIAVCNSDTGSQTATATSRTAMSSHDGITWTPSFIPLQTWFTAVCAGIGSAGFTVYIAVGQQGSLGTTARVAGTTGSRLDSGLAWFPVTSTVMNSSAWNGIAYGDGKFVAVASSGTNMVATSQFGESAWTARAAPHYCYSVIYAGGQFVAVGQGCAMTSPDGITWTSRTVPENNLWWGLTYGNGLYVTVSYVGTNRVMTSPDGITWTARKVPNGDWYSVAFGDGKFVAVSSLGNKVMTSVNGINWFTEVATEFTNAAGYWITTGPDKFVSVGPNSASYRGFDN